MSGIAPDKIQRALALELDGNDAGAVTIREYLTRLLTLVWREEDVFDGKRPFGNCGWKADFDRELIVAGLVNGDIDEDGFVTGVDDDARDELIFTCIVTLGYVEVMKYG